jgi:16S rRNA (cytidine1402-2'-O)-methyltransferase
MSNKGKLYLIPNTLGSSPEEYVTPFSREICSRLQHFVVEEIKSARKCLRAHGIEGPLERFEYIELNEHTRHDISQDVLNILLNGQDVGLISEAGLPCVADPGSSLVRKLQEFGMRIIPLSGPSSIFMALMASGLNGQQFEFHGYAPRESAERIKKWRHIDQHARQSTQIVMDTPYRNMNLFEDLAKHLSGDRLLCVAVNISCSDEWIVTRRIDEWRAKPPRDFQKRPAMFLIGY